MKLLFGFCPISVVAAKVGPRYVFVSYEPNLHSMIIRKLRLERAWSQEQLAEFSGRSIRTMNESVSMTN